MNHRSTPRSQDRFANRQYANNQKLPEPRFLAVIYGVLKTVLHFVQEIAIEVAHLFQ